MRVAPEGRDHNTIGVVVVDVAIVEAVMHTVAAATVPIAVVAAASLAPVVQSAKQNHRSAYFQTMT